MTAGYFLLFLVVVTALAFDFTNGFHDTANAMAPSIATQALTPKAAVTLCAVLNLVGAFLSIEVALTVTNAVIKIQNPDGSPRAELLVDGGSPLLLILLAGLVGGILWNIFSWMKALPTSSSHALLGGLVGATIASSGFGGVKWIGDGTKLDGVIGKVVIPGFIAPVIAIVVAMLSTRVIFWITKGLAQRYMANSFRWGQIGSASLISLSHGTNDAQKTMGVITLALIASGHWHTTDAIPWWVKVACALAIAAGTYSGGWRIIRTLGKGLVEIAPAQGMAADCSSAAVILTSSHFGFALSTTHVATGSILGSGVGRPGATVRWGVAGRMLVAWLITLPCAAVVGALTWHIANGLGGWLGGLVIFVLLAATAGLMVLRTRNQPVGSHNVNEEWTAPAPGRTKVAH